MPVGMRQLGEQMFCRSQSLPVNKNNNITCSPASADLLSPGRDEVSISNNHGVYLLLKKGGKK